MNNDPISGTESMQIIQNMINNAKNQFSENGFMYLLWGWAVFICSVGQFALYTYGYPQHYIVWCLTWLVLIVQFFYLRKERRTRRVKTYTEDILKYVWICFVVVMFLNSFLLGQMMGPGYYKYIYPVLLVTYGIPTFLSGIILRFRPLVIGGVACWVLAILSARVTYEYQILLLSAAVIVAWIVPGYLLRARYKKENN